MYVYGTWIVLSIQLVFPSGAAVVGNGPELDVLLLFNVKSYAMIPV